jgi:hypothetical protein
VLKCFPVARTGSGSVARPVRLDGKRRNARNLFAVPPAAPELIGVTDGQELVVDAPAPSARRPTTDYGNVTRALRQEAGLVKFPQPTTEAEDEDTDEGQDPDHSGK